VFGINLGKVVFPTRASWQIFLGEYAEVTGEVVASWTTLRRGLRGSAGGDATSQNRRHPEKVLK